MVKFIGRTRELALLNNLLKKKTASLVVIKGRRRIGKSCLAEKFGSAMRFIAVSGLPPTHRVTAQQQCDAFAAQLRCVLNIPIPHGQDWDYLFWLLAEQTKTGRVVILLDEISWMGSKDSAFLGKLKIAWDQYFKKNDKLILMLCGSVSLWIEENIIKNTGFLGRISLKIHLKEMSLTDCDKFWGVHRDRISAYEKFKLISVMGGVPSYLEKIISSDTAEENIRQLCFSKEGVLFSEFDQIFHELFGRRDKLYAEILNCLLKFPHAELKKIYLCLGMEKQGIISQYLQDLEEAGFVKRNYTWRIKRKMESKLSYFQISDNYVRFYLKYIRPNKNRIMAGAFDNRAMSTLPGFDTIMGFQFENIVLNNSEKLHQLLHIPESDIIHAGPYFQNKTKKHVGCQIDYMIQTKFNCLYICEIKFSKNKLSHKIVQEIKLKIEALNLPKYFSYRPILVHVNGVSDSLMGCEFFSDVVAFDNLLTGC